MGTMLLDMLFIINPVAGRKSKLPIVSKLTEAGCKVVFAEHAGHAEEIARKAEEKTIVAIGGDGTVNEVARGLLGSDKVMGIIPCGSGDGLALHLGISRDISRAFETIMSGNIRSIDAGIINGKPFFSVCGVGFDAIVSEKFAKMGTRGFSSYVKAGLDTLLDYKPEKYTITIDDNSYDCEASLIAIGNSSQWGNGAKITPLADISDGLLDVTIADGFNLSDVPSLSCLLMTGMLDKSKKIHCHQGKHIHISREKTGPAHADGDWFEAGTDIDICIIPSALKVLAPKI